MTETETSARRAERYLQMQGSAEFAELRRRFRRFVFPMTAAFLAWYVAYVLLATYAHDFMNIAVIGNLSIGFVLGLGQFVSTFAITAAYVRWANRRLDPAAERLRRDFESGEGQDGREPEPDDAGPEPARAVPGGPHERSGR